MKPVHQILSTELFWKQPRWSREYYELTVSGKPRSEDDLVATVSWTKWLSEEAVAATHENRWLFDRVGFIDRHTIAWDEATGVEAGSVEFGWLGDGKILLVGGKTYQWYRSKTLAPAWSICDNLGSLVLEIELGRHWIKQEGIITLNRSRSNMDDLSLLLPLSLYLGICAQRDSAAVVAATTSAAVS